MEVDGDFDIDAMELEMARNGWHGQDTTDQAREAAASTGRTLLPKPVASMISLATRSTSFALRLGTVIGGYGLGAAKFTTLSSLELGRGILEGILSRAGKDALTRSNSDLGRESAETILEKSLESLHHTMMHMIFWTTAGYSITETTVSSVSQISQLLLSSLDQFFGSTDSSRAIASIITLIRHEFRNPATGVNGEKVGVVDLILGLCGLAYLQNSCSRIIREEAQRLGHEEVIWDIVVLNNGARADVHQDGLTGAGRNFRPNDESSGQLLEALEKRGAYDSNSDEDLAEVQLRKQIMETLPKDARVSISTSTTTTKIITVEVQGGDQLPLLAPPGADLIEREITTPDSHQLQSEEQSPAYRLVYRISRERQRNSIIQPTEADESRPCIELDDGGDNDEEVGFEKDDKPPPVPPKSPKTIPKAIQTRPRRSLSSASSSSSKTPLSPRDRSSHIPIPKKSPETTANQKKTRQPLLSSKDTRATGGAKSQPGIESAQIGGNTPVPHLEKRTSFKNVLKKGTVSGLAGRWGKDSGSEDSSSKSKPNVRTPTRGTNTSQTSLVLSSYHQKSAYADSEAVDTLRKTGMVDGMFPEFHILRNITRYSRYASAAYGSHFLNLMGIAKDQQERKARDDTHQDIRSFAQHTQLPPNSVLLSSFVDPQGGSDSSGSTETGIPLVHTIAVDRESKAIVLACRGTLGFEDVLSDMMCDYDDLAWRGKAYKVHKGIHASARRLLYGGDGRVLFTLKEALEEFPEFGLVLCGHSLGGAVAALLGAMLAEPATTGTAFVTSAQQHKRLLSNGMMTTDAHIPVNLPAGRPIHVFAYGPPATMSPALRLATRGLITSVVHGNDLVPYLSLGVLHDMQALALAFKTDNNEAKAEVRRRVWQSFQTGLSDKWYNNAPKLSTEDDAQWSYAALKTLRASMMSSKLLPPGEIFAVESTPALRRDAFVQTGGEFIGRTATRIVLKYIRDVENHFREIKFGASMLTDHSPGRYEDALRRLALGVM
ncbi:hypothetical protein KJ359_013068 [Pestalotiopsis sp. 9143b]|nr:hypothetical protein KJ359_013068 [Pestalotiopsis sp. 9143b]